MTNVGFEAPGGGFEAPETLIGLDFSETPYAGLEVTVAAGSMGEFLDLEDLAAAGENRQMFRRFAALLRSWNLTRGGVPVPATYEGMLTLEPAFTEMIITVWQRNVTSAPPPLQNGSPSGASSPEAQLAQASRSLNPQN
jgi:hypothetical protein